MKKIYVILGVAAACLLAFYAGDCIVNRGTIKITRSEDKKHSKFTALYPTEVSDAVIAHVNQWASQATQRSGELSGTLQLKFSNGISCRLHAKGRNLEIIADRANNNDAALTSLKDECNDLNAFILAKSNKSR